MLSSTLSPLIYCAQGADGDAVGRIPGHDVPLSIAGPFRRNDVAYFDRTLSMHEKLAVLARVSRARTP